MTPSLLLSGFRFSNHEHRITNFSSQLRDDFQSVFLIWLTPFPDSLTAVTDLLVPILAFKVSQIIPQFNLTVNDERGIITRMTTIDFNESFPVEQILSASCVTLNLPRPPKRFYRHGWQSWSLAAWTELTPLPIQKPRILHPLQVDPVYAKEARPHSSWIGAVEFDDGKVLLLGSLGLDAHVTLNGNQLEGRYESGNGAWIIAHGDEASVFAKYADELGKRLGKKSAQPAPRVWCSWYSLYTAIDEPLLCKIFDDLGNLPFDILQVDDGWQIKVGDWEANQKFPSGMKALAEKIKSTGRKAGLWLAPLIAVKSSKLFRKHPDWFLRDERGKFVSAGFNWGEQLYALDATHPAALEWLAELMKQVRAWGFDYLKLDFLYGGALPGKRKDDMPREAAYRHGTKVLREAMGADAYFLTCGAPIIPSLGLCDALRAGPDVAGEWENRDATLLFNPAIPSAKNAIRTIIHRRWLESLIQIDPDVAYFRSIRCSLTADQKLLLQDLALICNFKATSDLPQWLSDFEREQLRGFLEASPVPVIEQTGVYTFLVNGKEMDFNSAIPLPEPPQGWSAIKGNALGWLANHGWALKILDNMNKRAWEKMRKGLEYQ